MTKNMSLGKWSIDKMEKYDTLHLILYIERELPRVNSSFWNRSLSLSFLVFCVFVFKRGGRGNGLKFQSNIGTTVVQPGSLSCQYLKFPSFQLWKTQTLDSDREEEGGSKQWRMRSRKLNCHNFCHKSWLLRGSRQGHWRNGNWGASPFNSNFNL